LLERYDRTNPQRRPTQRPRTHDAIPPELFNCWNDTTAQTPNGALPNGRAPKTGLCDPSGRHLPETAGR
jgi:hypothetical protein